MLAMIVRRRLCQSACLLDDRDTCSTAVLHVLVLFVFPRIVRLANIKLRSSSTISSTGSFKSLSLKLSVLVRCLCDLSRPLPSFNDTTAASQWHWSSVCRDDFLHRRWLFFPLSNIKLVVIEPWISYQRLPHIIIKSISGLASLALFFFFFFFFSEADWPSASWWPSLGFVDTLFRWLSSSL